MNFPTKLANASQPVSYTDRDRTPFEVLLTAIDSDLLMTYSNSAVLPQFDDGTRWTVQQEVSVHACAYFDLAIVLCANVAQYAESVALVERLTVRRITTVMLVPAKLESRVSQSPTFLTVVTSSDLPHALTMLAHILLAPVQQDGLVCCDWADILGVMRDGGRAQLVSAEAPSVGEALLLLKERLAPIATGNGYGAIATLYTDGKDHMRNYYALLHIVMATARQDAMVVASAPIRKGSASIAAAIVVTIPSSHYFRDSAGD